MNPITLSGASRKARTFSRKAVCGIATAAFVAGALVMLFGLACLPPCSL